MKVERGVWANCSEATMRFKVDKLTKEEEEKLFKTLNTYVEKYNYETWVYRNMIFGIKCITVDGDAPYNDDKGLTKSVKKLSFMNKVAIEMEEK